MTSVPCNPKHVRKLILSGISAGQDTHYSVFTAGEKDYEYGDDSIILHETSSSHFLKACTTTVQPVPTTATPTQTC